MALLYVFLRAMFTLVAALSETILAFGLLVLNLLEHRNVCMVIDRKTVGIK